MHCQSIGEIEEMEIIALFGRLPREARESLRAKRRQ
jgi:hypothetical protein